MNKIERLPTVPYLAAAVPDERRLDARVAADLTATAYLNGRARSCRILDLSCSGALIAIYLPSRDGRFCRRMVPGLHRLEIDLGGKDVLRVAVEVVWSRRGSYAVRFCSAGDVDRLQLAEHIDRLMAVHFLADVAHQHLRTWDDAPDSTRVA